MFIVNPKYREHLGLCWASAIVMTQDDLPSVKSAALVMKNPYLTYTHMAQILNTMPQPAQSTAPSAVIDVMAKLDSNVPIGANAMIELGVELGDNMVIDTDCFTGKDNRIGVGSCLWANITTYHETQIGQSCLIQSGIVVGADSFGYANDRGDWVKIPQTGRVVIGDRMEIGACTTVDHGTLDNTIISSGAIIDNQCQIAYNVVISDSTAVVDGITMAGSLKIGHYCMIDGASIVNGHMKICNRVAVMGMSMMVRLITESGVHSSDIPSQPDKVWRKTAALVVNIDGMSKRLESLERKVNQQD